MKIRKKGVYFILFIFVAVAAALFIKTRLNKPSKKTLVREISPVYGSIETVISTTGTVKPQNRLEIKPSIAGRIEQVLVKEGQLVEAGEILALMSSTERAALLDAAYLKGEEVEYWRQVYKATPLVAAIDAEVIVRSVEPGQTVTASDVIVVLSDRLIVKAQFDETDIAKVKLGQTAFIGLDAYPKVRVKAKVDHISYESQVVNNVTTYEVDVLPETTPEVFRSGMSANVEIIEKSKASALLLPLEAIQRDQEGSFVFLSKRNGNSAVKQRVALGISDETNIEVTSGVGPQDKIIIQTEEYHAPKDMPAGGNPFMPFGRGGRKK
ncbi:efflux RND transporter periplasmic adaptor subunit [Candidatus Omnitrophota bacterium]